MAISGLCAICQAEEATAACDRCGSLVCDAHFDTTSHLCTNCLAERGGGERTV